ncbi:type II toxin-antitoxin system YafO family toxin [Pseudomonas soli]|uniref:type II toxin-antitoxin system YafO family toxin n=1 Tax=Pseudomonas soli TaxID=1306993 RepID=UPI0004CEA867|nr:hypothetical protein O165_005630 [Pseudomonas soli]
MTTVVVSRRLTLITGYDEAQAWADEFSLWKQGGIGPGDTFGKTTDFVAPPAIVGQLSKVHLENDYVSARWNRMLDEGIDDPQAYTSDKILVFGRAWDAPLSPYFLLSLLDPDAHEQMKDWPMLSELGVHFNSEARAFSQDFPTISGWVTAGFPAKAVEKTQ